MNQQVSTLNNEGVNLIMNGDLPGAKLCFQRALQRVRRNIILAAGQPAQRNVTFGRNLESIFDETDAVLRSLRHKSVLYVRDSALFLHESLTTGDDGEVNHGNIDNDPVNSLLTAVVLFNLALISHHEAYSLGDIGLRIAEIHYQGVIEIIAGSVMLATGELSVAMMYMVLLAMNNQSEIYYDRCSFGEASSRVREMTEILEHLASLDHGLRLAPMLLNSYMQIPPSCARAA